MERLLEIRDHGITWEQFVLYIKELKSISDDLDDKWEIIENNNVPYGIYLVKKIDIMVDTENSNSLIFEEISSKKENCNVANVNKNSVLKFEYNITYSTSYAVPVLCFNVHKRDGTVLTLHDVWNIINDEFKQEDMYSFITQMDHAVLQKPYITLHPCKTRELLSELPESTNPLITWLSSVGPTIHLKLSMDYLEKIYPMNTLEVIIN